MNSFADIAALANSFDNCEWKDLQEVKAAKAAIIAYIENGVSVRTDVIMRLVDEFANLKEKQGYCFGMAIAAAKEKELKENG